MKKDIFNGKIKQEHIGTALISIILGSAVFLACAVTFLCMGLFYADLQQDARMLMCVVSVVCFVCAIGFPVASIICARTYPKYKRLAHRLLKDYVFVQDQNNGKDA